jgi:hypothetical protein
MMRSKGKSLRIILILFGILAVLTVGVYLGLSFYAVTLIQPKIQEAMGSKIILSDVKVKMTHLSIKGIHYEEKTSKKRIFQIEEIKVYPSILSFLRGYLRVKEIVLLKPSFFLFRSRETGFLTPLRGIGGKEEKRDDFREEKRRQPFPLKIDHIRVQNGFVGFEDRKTGYPYAQFNLKDLDVQIEGVKFPLLETPFPFKLNGRMRGREREGFIKMEGWLNLEALEFESALSLREIGVKDFEPYYRKKVSTEVENGLIHIEAKVVLKKRVIDIHGDMELVGLQIKRAAGKIFWIPADLFSSQLKKKGGRLKIPFHIRGDLDDSKFNLQESLLTALGFSLARSLGMPVKIFPDGREEIRGGGI